MKKFNVVGKTIIVNGKTYDLSNMSLPEKILKMVEDKNKDGLPDIFEDQIKSEMAKKGLSYSPKQGLTSVSKQTSSSNKKTYTPRIPKTPPQKEPGGYKVTDGLFIFKLLLILGLIGAGIYYLVITYS